MSENRKSHTTTIIASAIIAAALFILAGLWFLLPIYAPHWVIRNGPFDKQLEMVFYYNIKQLEFQKKEIDKATSLSGIPHAEHKEKFKSISRNIMEISHIYELLYQSKRLHEPMLIKSKENSVIARQYAAVATIYAKQH